MSFRASPPLDVAPEIADAIARNRPVVAIESVIVSPAGLYPSNVSLFNEVSDAMRASDVVPALVAVIDGRIVVGASSRQLEQLGRAKAVPKVGKRELALALVKGGVAMTTVSATLYCAHLCGIPIAMTGAIGGVHRGYEDTLDVSSDLEELGTTPVAVVCTGAKIILDLARTLEYLETKSVPVIGLRVSNFPAYFCSTRLSIERINEPAEVAALMEMHWALGLETGLVVAVPPSIQMSEGPLEALVLDALTQARQDSVSGKALTPYLLKHLDTATAGESERMRRAAILDVAKAAGEISIAYAARCRHSASNLVIVGESTA
ncbi:MAG: pseudouridine-5'-phosphate glycosidase [Afipia sp.]|nr:pseudouridine-5'-phosphate glycosidase [Afipia sp.]